MSPLSPQRTFLNSLPIAGIMLFWLVISWIASHPLVGGGARLAGLVMALTYAITKGITSAPQAPVDPLFVDIRSTLRTNGLALLAAGGWFILAKLVILAEQLWRVLALPGLFTSPDNGLIFAFTSTGVVTVVLYAVTLGTVALRDEVSLRQDTTVSNGSPADD